MPLLLRSRYLLTSALHPPIEDGALLIEDDRVVAVGAFKELQQGGCELRDYGDAVLLPPLVNAHCHLELTDFPRWAVECDAGPEPDSFVGWIQRLVRIRRRLGPQPIPDSIRRGIAQLLASGTGAVGDIVSWLPGAAVSAASPLHGRLYCETIGLDADRYLEALSAALDVAAPLRHPLPGGLSPHAPYSISAAHLQAAVRSGLPLAIHCAEAPEELEFVREGRGPFAEILYPAAGWVVPPPANLSPVAWLDSCGALTPRTLLIHGVQVDEADVALIARKGCSVVLCPRSNARLQAGVAPLELYRRYRVPLCLGTDSLASNDSLSLWDEIAYARRLYPELPPPELLTMATVTGAQALGMKDDMGALTAGRAASFQVVGGEGIPARSGEVVEWLCSGEHRVEALRLDGREVA